MMKQNILAFLLSICIALLIFIQFAFQNSVVYVPNQLAIASRYFRAVQSQTRLGELPSGWLGEDADFENVTSEIENKSQNDPPPSSLTTINGCPVEEWNLKYTDSVPHKEEHEKWFQQRLSAHDNMAANLSLLAAYVYSDHIAITITSQNLYGRMTYCRYLDCRRNEIQSPFESKVFPEATVLCPRRPGAVFVSLTHSLQETPPFSVPLIQRLSPTPRHEFSICLAPLYGDEPKWLQIVEFVEHHKLQGVTHFYVYAINVDEYSRRILNDYIRTGEIELIQLQDAYIKPDFLFHIIQIYDCHRRSMYDSKWTAFIDIDERLTTTNYTSTVADYLRFVSETYPQVGDIQWRVQWVQKTTDTPKEYVDEQQLLGEMIFLKHRNTSSVGPPGAGQKRVVRPEKVGIMSIHFPEAIYGPTNTMQLLPSVAVVRHYRNTKFRAITPKWVEVVSGYGVWAESPRAPLSDFELKLARAVVDRVKFVYQRVAFNCSTVSEKVLGWRGLTDPCSPSHNWSMH